MASVENVKTQKKGRELSCELKDFPVSFANAIRRILLGKIPTVVIRDVKIVENTTRLPHEMLKHRVEMLPVNVLPHDSVTIKDAKITLHILPSDEKMRTITTDDFVTTPAKILMKDQDLDTPILFLYMRNDESLHIEASLALENEQVSQVSTATTKWHIDPELAKKAREEHVKSENDPRLFDNFLVQRYYSRNELGRPNWIDLTVESIGVIPATELLKLSIAILKKDVADYLREALSNIQKEPDGTFYVTLEQGGHTIGYLFQETMYLNKEHVSFVSYDVTHPLRKTTVLRFNTSQSPESVLKTANDMINEYCSVVEKGL
jgi:DNA-directed RNA polymerase subunit L